jgi:hypothetical protein
MEEIIRLLTSDSNELIYLFLKAFAVLFSVSYLVYAVVITRQTQSMNKTFTTKSSGILFFISFLQIVFALVLIFVSFTLL